MVSIFSRFLESSRHVSLSPHKGPICGHLNSRTHMICVVCMLCGLFVVYVYVWDVILDEVYLVFSSHPRSVGCSWRGWSCWPLWTKSEFQRFPTRTFYYTSYTSAAMKLLHPVSQMWPVNGLHFLLLFPTLPPFHHSGRAWFPWWERRCWCWGTAGTSWSSWNSWNWWTQGEFMTQQRWPKDRVLSPLSTSLCSS